MKTYQSFGSSPDGWNVSSTLALGDDGRFSYSEGWTDYTNASLSGGAEGRWRRDGGVLVFEAEEVGGAMYFPWVVGKELDAVERKGALDFGGGWTLHEPGEREVKIPVRNEGGRPLVVRLEPWGISNILEPGEALRIHGRGPWGAGSYEVDYGEGEVVYHGWPGSRVDLVYEPKQPAPLVTPAPPAPPARPAKPKAPPAAETETPPPRPPPYVPPRVNPFTISPGLAARLRGWIDELPTEGLGNWVVRLCKSHDALPLHGTQLQLWALRTDGQVLVIDHESASQSVEPETDGALAYAALAQGARSHPELAELLADNPEGVFKCLHCDGRGHAAAEPPAAGMSPCAWCHGMGWRPSAS